MDTSSLINHMIRAARLDVDFYEQVEADSSYNQEALFVVIIAAVAGGIGSFLSALFGGSILSALLGLVAMIALALIGYYIWAFIAYWVGTSIFKGTATSDEVRRTLGYAYAPQALAILSFIPCVGSIIVLVASLWSLVAAVIAIRQSLDFDTTKAILTVIVGWFVVLIFTLIVGLVLGVGSLGLGMLTG